MVRLFETYNLLERSTVLKKRAVIGGAEMQHLISQRYAVKRSKQASAVEKK